MTSADQGDITNGKFFQLDEDQKKFLNEIANDRELKDIIIFGEYLINIFYTEIS